MADTNGGDTHETAGITPLHATTRAVAFQEVDAGGGVSAACLLAYFHDAYFAWLGAHGVDLPKTIAERRWGAPVVHAEVDVAAPLAFGDAVVVEIVRAEIGRTSLTLTFRARRGDEVVAAGKTVSAFVDVSGDAPRARAVPDEIRAAVDASVTPATAARTT